MNPNDTNDSGSGFDSRDCVDLVYDGPGDTEVRPLRPALMAQALAEREKLARYKELGWDSGESEKK